MTIAIQKTREEVEHLKRGWVDDPCFDLEDTEGFEEYRDELLAFSVEQKAKWGEANRKEIERISKPLSAAEIRIAYREAPDCKSQLLREIAAQLAEANELKHTEIEVFSQILDIFQRR